MMWSSCNLFKQELEASSSLAMSQLRALMKCSFPTSVCCKSWKIIVQIKAGRSDTHPTPEPVDN